MVERLLASRGVFVGRQAELDVMSRALEGARASDPQIVWIEGEPGIGKTAFVRQFLASAEDIVTLEVSGDETEATLDFGVLSQILAQATPTPRSEPPNESPSKGSPGGVFAVGAELLGLLGSLESYAPLVLVIDDVQWVDQPSAGVLLFTLRRLCADRVLVVVVSRPEGVDRLGPGWSKLLNDSERAQRLSLFGLGAHEVRELAGSLDFGGLTLAAAERLREHTGGNPLRIKALLNELPREALAFDQGPLPAPQSFAATVLARLTGVASEAQDLVAAAAVAGAQCPLTLAGSVAGLSDPLDPLEEALTAELLVLVPTRIPEELRFPHPLVRAAIYDDLSPRRRHTLHLAWARVTRGTASLFHRVAASDGADDALANELAAAGEDEVAAGALAVGIEHLLWASRIADSRQLREAALLRAVEWLGMAGDVPRAHGFRDEVMSCSDSPRRSFILGVLTASAGRLPEAEEALRDVIGRADFPGHPELLGPVTSSLAIVCAYAGQGADAIAWARRALEVDESTATVEVTAKQALALGLAMSGRAPEGIALLEALSPGRIDPQPFEPELMATRGNLKAWCGDLRGAVEDLSAVIRWSRAGTPLRNLPNAYGSLAEAEYHLGRWDEGLVHADLAVSLAQDSDQLWELPFVHAVTSFFHAGRGNWRFASEHVEAARRAAQLAPLPVSIYYGSVAAANLAQARGDWEAVLLALEPLEDSSSGRVADFGHRTWELLAAEAMHGTHRGEDANRVLAELEEALGGSISGVVGVGICRLRGILEHARGHPAKARAVFRQGQDVAQTTASPIAGASLALAHGRFLRRTGSRRAAIATLRDARECFDVLRARPLVERCDAELAACGIRPKARGTDDYGLTPREQVVARLVAQGQSNREVAAELYLSTKAIEYHLANIFSKVGIRSRHQLGVRLTGVLTAKPDQSRADAALR